MQNHVTRRPRLAFYSHDTQGLGHIRRNLLIATTLAYSELRPVVLMITGAREAAAFAMPPRTDCVVLPGLGKQLDGQYTPRALDLPLSELTHVRAKTIRAAVESFDPDLFVIDKVPLGALGELWPCLEFVRSRGYTRCVLGLRDVLDEPAAARREWEGADSDRAVSAYYDEVWIYGDQAVYDPAREYGFSQDVVARARYTGYLGRCLVGDPEEPRDDRSRAVLDALPGRMVLCLVGGGQDGFFLADSFAKAELPHGAHGVIVTGPFMPRAAREDLSRRAAGRSRLHVLQFVVKPELLIQRADRIVAMGGYNSICEILSFEKRALIVPRVTPRREQLIRAQRFSALGLLDLLHPDELTPERLSKWMSRADGPPPNVREHVDLCGLERVPDLTKQLLAQPATDPRSAWQSDAPVRVPWVGPSPLQSI